MNINTCRRCRAMNHPSRETCRGCGVELVYNPMRPRTDIPRPQGGKALALAALCLVLLVTTGIGLYSVGALDGLISTTAKSLKNLDQESAIKGREIWDKHLEMSGEKDKPQPKSVVMRGDATIIPKVTGKIPKDAPPLPTINGKIEYYYKAPGKIYSRAEFTTPGHMRQPRQTVIAQKYFDGEKGWEKKTQFNPEMKLNGEIIKNNWSEKTEELSGEAVEDLKNEMFSRMTGGYTSFRYERNSFVDGKSNHCLIAEKSNGSTETIYVDAETYLVSKIEFEMKPGEKPEAIVKDITFSSYRPVNNVQMPFSMYMSMQEMFFHTTMTEIAFDTEIDDGVFQLK